MDPFFESGMSEAFCDAAAFDAAAAAAASSALPPPPADRGFSRACDVLECPLGLGWTGVARHVHVSSCSKCGEARYCSQACQKSAWPGWASAGVTGVVGHKLWCGTLRAAPRPLRLIQRLVGSAKLEALGLVKLNKETTDSDPESDGSPAFWDLSDRSMGVDVDVHFADTLFSAKRGMQPSAAVELRALMEKNQAQSPRPRHSAHVGACRKRVGTDAPA